MKLFKNGMKKWALACMAVLPMVVSAETINVNIGKKYQEIKGFGGMNYPAWTGGDLTDSQRKTAFGNGDNELGLSILRIHVDPNENAWGTEVATAQYASKQGALVFASPWHPKDNMCESYKNSKRLKSSAYGDYVKHLNNFIDYMTGKNVPLYAISIQNEPDYGADWTWWEPNDMATFMANNAQNIKCKVMAPEAFQYNKNTSDPILKNDKALANLDIMATHFYGTQVSQMSYPLFQQKGAGKELWMTEVYVPNSDANSGDRWPEAVQVADNMSNALAVGNMQAYVWWYIRRSYGLMNENGTISKRGSCFAQFSKFVRPGFVRVDATQRPATNVNVTAFTKDQDVVIVLVNNNNSAKSMTINVPNTQIASWDRYVTNSSQNVKKVSGINANGTTIQVSLEAYSVTTLVGQGQKGLPKVNFTSPTASDDLEAPATIKLAVDAKDENGSIQSVAFYNGTTKLGESNSAPYTYTWEGVKEGTYELIAVAKDNEGNEGKASVKVRVHVPQAPYKDIAATIPGKIQAEEYDLGGSGVAYQDNDDENQGDGSFRTDEGVDVVKSDDGLAVGYTNAGEWMEYTVDVKSSDTYKWTAKVASGSDVSAFSVSIDGNQVISKETLPKGESWDIYYTLTGKTARIEEGKHVMRINIEGNYTNIDWINFVAENPDLTGIEEISVNMPCGTYNVVDITGKILGSVVIAEGETAVEKLKEMGIGLGVYILSNEKESIKVEVGK